MSPRFIPTLWALFLPFSCHVGTEKWGNQSARGSARSSAVCANIRMEREKQEQRERGRTRRRRNGVNSRISVKKMGIFMENSARMAWLCVFLPLVLFLFLFVRPKPISLEICLGNIGDGRSVGRSCGGFPPSLLPAQRSSWGKINIRKKNQR